MKAAIRKVAEDTKKETEILITGDLYRFGIRISFNFAISDGLSSYKLAKVLAVVGPSIGSTSKSAFFASAISSGSRNVLMNPCWRTCRRSGRVPGATE